MELVVRFWKEIGETPLEALRRFQSAHPAYVELKGTYAGRLDPAAEGELIFLFGDKVYEKESYLQFSKTYTATFLFGVSTDTGDLLGIPTHGRLINKITKEQIKKIADIFSKTTEQVYPRYSSKTVHGKPLFTYARNSKDVVQPVRNIKIYTTQFLGQEFVSNEDVKGRVKMLCEKVVGDFRQHKILDTWTSTLPLLPEKILTITFILTVSSGTYIRALNDILEKELNMPSCLFSLVRTKIEK